MEYVPALKSLIAKGFVMITDLSECRLVRQNFMVTNYVIGCILENRKPECKHARLLEKEFDRYDFCKMVDSQIQDDDITTESMLQFVESIERDNATMPLVVELKKIISRLPDRALFYEICHDFFDRDGNGRSDLTRTLRDMYQAYGVRFKVRKALLDGTSPLIEARLVEVSGNKETLSLTVAGQRLFWAMTSELS